MTTAEAAEATKTRTALPPRFDRLAPALCEQLGPTLSHLVELCLDDSQLQGFRRFLGLKHAAGRGRPATARVLAVVFLDLCDGPCLVNVSDLARRAALSRPSVYKAIAYVTEPTIGRPKLVRVDPRATGPRRSAKWQIRADILENPASQRPQEKAASSASVNLPTTFLSETTSKPQAGEPARSLGESLPLRGRCASRREAPSAQTTDPKALLSWLDSPALDLDRVPAFSERRKMAATLRAVADPRLADPLLSALFWRAKSLPFSVWRTAARSILDTAAEDPDRWQVPEPAQKYLGNGLWRLSTREDPPPEHWSRQSRRSLDWRSRLAIRHLVTSPGDGAGFLAILEDGPPERPGDAVRRIIGLEASILGASRVAWAIRTAGADENGALVRPGTCPTCGEPLRGDRWLHRCHADALARAGKLRRLRWQLLEAAALSPAEAADRLAVERRALAGLVSSASTWRRCPLCGLPVRYQRPTKTRREVVFDDYRRRNPYTFELGEPEQGPHDCHTRLLATIERLETLTQTESEVHV